MCTLYSFTQEWYRVHRDALHARVRTDAWANADGVALLTLGAAPKDAQLLRTMSVDTALALLDYQLGPDGPGARAWLHLRSATQGDVGLTTCHGFAAGDWVVFHNGVLSRAESRGFAVDSELIAWDIETVGVDEACRALLAKDHFANVFAVNVATGAFHVVRSGGGSLYTTAGADAYSTNPVADITLPVPPATWFLHREFVQAPPVATFTAAPWAHLDPDDALTALVYTHTFDDFEDLAQYEGWWRHGVPAAVWSALSPEQYDWAQRLGLWTRLTEVVA